jgi:hypothetical protein
MGAASSKPGLVPGPIFFNTTHSTVSKPGAAPTNVPDGKFSLQQQFADRLRDSA